MLEVVCVSNMSIVIHSKQKHGAGAIALPLLIVVVPPPSFLSDLGSFRNHHQKSFFTTPKMYFFNTFPA